MSRNINNTTMDQYRLIKGVEAISKYMGMCDRQFRKKHRDTMLSFGLLWRDPIQHQSKFITTPFAIAAYLIVDQLSRNSGDIQVLDN
jgi:hypothetical protein